ncbi:MAG: S8 family serine peptidase, partial [Planctomycetota bacterium]
MKSGNHYCQVVAFLAALCILFVGPPAWSEQISASPMSSSFLAETAESTDSYAVPVGPSEGFVESLEVAGAIANVAIFQDTSPWGSTRNQDILAANGISFTIFGSGRMGLVDLSVYDKVIISSVQGSTFYGRLEANRAWFESYVAAGGVLDLHVATQGPEPMLPGGFVCERQIFDDVTIVDATHPIVTTPNPITDADLDGWNYSTHGYFRVIPGGAYEIIEIAGSGQPCAMELLFGRGRIFATTQTVEWGGASYDYLENTILYEIVDDLSISPAEGFISSGEVGGPFTPPCKAYTLTNNGPNLLDWSAVATEPWLDVSPHGGVLGPYDSNVVHVCINAIANTKAPGIYTDTVIFSNLTSGVDRTRGVKLHVGAKSVLSYVQYTDTSREYPNTLAGISSVGTNYSVTELADYTQLDSMLPGHDILLIPEQEKAYSSQLQSIGIAWATTLQNFVNNGGVVIQCIHSGRYEILTGSGLMNISSSDTFGGLVNTITPDDPVAQGVSGSYTAVSGSAYIDSPDGVVVAERTGYGPVVINKRMGLGHVVFIGHDYYLSNSDQDRIVGNAVFNLPVIVDDLVISPREDFNSVGDEGGPFAPNNKEYSLRNIGPNSLDWRVEFTCPWLDADSNGGTLPPDSNTVLRISLNAHANSLDPNIYSGTITLSNLTSGLDQTRQATLTVIRVPGEIEITDSILPVDDLNMHFGDVIKGLSRTEHITITNVDPNHKLTVNIRQFEGFYDEFPTTTIDPGKWTSIISHPTIDDVGLGEPSAPYSLRLNGDPDGGEAVASGFIDLSGLSGVELTYWYERTGGGEDPDPGEDLIFEYWSGSGWIELERQFGDGPDMTYYVQSTVPLPDEALHDNFRLRIRSIGSYCACDDWFVDDVSITMTGDGLSLPQNIPVGDAFWLENMPNLPVTIEPLGHITFDVNFIPEDVVDYNSTLFIRSDDRDEPEVAVRLTGTGILDYLDIAPDANFEFSGRPGGPFVPTYETYQLTNIGLFSIEWTAAPNVPWLDVSPLSGSLVPGGSITVSVSPNAQADSMPGGYHCGEVIFTDITTTLLQARQVCLDAYTEPKIWVNPQSFNVTVAQGDTQTGILSIGNNGDSALDFTVSGSHISFTPPTEGEGIGSVVLGDDFITSAADSSYKPGELLVRFAPKANGRQRDKKEKEEILRSLDGGTIKHTFRLVPGLNVVKLPKGHKVKDVLEKFNREAGILYAQPNYKMTLDSAPPQCLPNDPRFDDLWGMHNIGQNGGTAGADINAPEAWCIRTAADDIIVAVIDTGVDYTHPDLAANMWVNEAEFDGTPGVDDDGNGYIDDIYGYDFYNDDGDPWDDHYHGTHCAGTIGGVGDNGIGVAGVCHDVQIMALKWIGSGGNGWTDDAVDCVEYSVLMGANLSSNSWRQDNPSVPNPALEDAINTAGAAGLLFVASAGNDNADNDVHPHYPSSYDANSVIAVLATDKYDNKSSFSCYGLTSVDLGAPGSSILSCAPGGGYQYLSGTSMATPHVAGACALVWSVCPSLTSLQVKDIILQTVDQLPALSGLCVSEGRLNLYKAILEAQETPCSGGNGPSSLWLDFEPSSGTVATGDTVDVNVIFHAGCYAGTYLGLIDVSSNDPYQTSLPIIATMTVVPIDYFTELFEPNYLDPNDPAFNDMGYRTLTFIPDGSSNYYSICLDEATDFPVDPAGGNVVSLGDDDYEAVGLLNSSVSFYGTEYDTFYICSNGYISFTTGDISHSESLSSHFDIPRISAMYDDLDPSAGGTISWKEIEGGIVVTFE